MRRIAFVGMVGAGKTTLFNALQGNYSTAIKTQAVEFNDAGDIDTPGEYFSHPRWFQALITSLQDVDLIIYIHAANEKENRLPSGLLNIGGNKRHIAVISKIDAPDANVDETRELLLSIGFQEPIFALNCRSRESIQPLMDYLATEQEDADENVSHRE
ncbi:EutP/PduV family microcompartment system protein [Yokenella regensburgei]|uniref:Ethanolamine utilization protein EutP n=1 Tax=Yokenella regensburgei TaxID=158877 RepID=A0AB38FWS4_9ENTR|nr:EutP/PduV family microcompartment system protein [Yokenella regensburgei]SQA63757.1 ethanolamine utilization protein EutP [Yokenella regensburgei]SQA65867.1 ethanolamine utilization protein EutP [Yokenella regensburgei]SUQ04486.1 ethanolamine utilization protein EutP [Yokenella regensburgei]